MIKPEQIPREVRKAAHKAYFNATELSWQGAVDAAVLAAIKSWPDAWVREVPQAGITSLILPLPENTNDKA